MYYRPIKGIGLGRMRYGANVSIDPGRLNTFLLVQMPLSGEEFIEDETGTVLSSTTIASVLSPSRAVRMQHTAATEKLFVRIDRSVLERHCIQHLGRELRQPVEFSPGMSLHGIGGSAWLRLMQWLYAEADIVKDGESQLDHPLFAAQVEQMVISTLLSCQPNNLSAELSATTPSMAPYFVKRVERYIEEHAHEPITVVDLAEASGVSTRSLYAGFRKFRNTTPMNHLKSIRLTHVREDLLNAAPDSLSVTQIALRWGFSHLGHFTAAYKRRFGECPSDTLKR